MPVSSSQCLHARHEAVSVESSPGWVGGRKSALDRRRRVPQKENGELLLPFFIWNLEEVSPFFFR